MAEHDRKNCSIGSKSDRSSGILVSVAVLLAMAVLATTAELSLSLWIALVAMVILAVIVVLSLGAAVKAWPARHVGDPGSHEEAG